MDVSENTKVLVEKGKKYLDEEKFEDALTLFQKAVKCDPCDMKIISYLHLAETLQLKKYLNDSSLLQSVPRINPAISHKLTDLNLQANEGFLLTQIDGNTDIKSLIYIGGMTKFKTLQLIDRFIKEDIIQVKLS